MDILYLGNFGGAGRIRNPFERLLVRTGRSKRPKAAARKRPFAKSGSTRYQTFRLDVDHGLRDQSKYEGGVPLKSE